MYRHFSHRQRGQSLAEVLGIAAAVLVVLLLIMWAVDRYRAKETKVAAPSSLTWSQGQTPPKSSSSTDGLPDSNDTFNAVPRPAKAGAEDEDEDDDQVTPGAAGKSPKANKTTASNSKDGEQNKGAPGGQPQKDNQSAALATSQAKRKVNPVQDLNAANAEMEAELMNTLMRRSNDARELGLDQDGASSALADKKKDDEEKILIPGVNNQH